MSQYLCERIAAQPNIEVLLETEVTELQGQPGHLEAIVWRQRSTGVSVRRELSQLFLFIGAQPNTSWLSGCDVAVDAKGFIRAEGLASEGRLPFQTSREGIFAIGDVRAGSVKRVAAAVGEGAQVVATLHAYLSRSTAKQSPTTAAKLEVVHG
jgi:thioredoxin reductase (NADPH)